MERNIYLLSLSLPVIFLALTIKKSKVRSAETHPFCSLHPVATKVCQTVTRLQGRDHLPREIIPLTESLVRIPSVSGREQSVTNFAKSWLMSNSLQVTSQKIPPLRTRLPSRRNLLAYPKDIASIRVLLSTHLDTVPKSLQVKRTSDRLYARGATDAKSQAAAMMITVAALNDPRVGVLFLAGEETDHAGMRRAHELGFNESITLVNGEPTKGKLVSFQKGMLKGVVKVTGVAAHSGYPELGSSAVHILLKLLNELLEMEWPVVDGVKTTMNIGVVKGGDAPNVVAASASADVLFRLGGAPEDVLAMLEKVLEKYENCVWETITMNAPYEFYVPQRVGDKFGTDVVAYNTDVPYYQGSLRRAVLFGAGSIEQAHTVDEFVGISQVEALPGQLKAIVTELLEIDEEECNA